MDPRIELWNNIALIRDDRYFTKWVREAGKLAHHDGFLDFLKPFLGGIMVDAGANVGTHSHYYAQFGKVHCFEPNPLAFECLAHNMQGLDATLYQVALGHRCKTINMSTPEDGNYGAMYTTPGDDIPMITLDSLHLEGCNFIKIDVEGNEIDVLQGARRTIEKYRPIMCIESNPDTLARHHLMPVDLAITLDKLGYRTTERVPQDISCDLLCIPKEHIAK